MKRDISVLHHLIDRLAARCDKHLEEGNANMDIAKAHDHCKEALRLLYIYEAEQKEGRP